MSDLLLSMDRIKKTFPGVLALDDVSIELRPGEVHAIVGENGAGKSTLMKILSGVFQPDAGALYYKGERIKLDGPQDARRRGISIIYQELTLAPHLTVAQNIFLGHEPVRYRGILDERRLYRDASAILNSVHLTVDPRTVVKDLGVSKQQMVEIAKALSVRSEVLIMDEPTSALSETEIDELFKIINRLKGEGVGIFYISHRLEELKHIVDRISVLRDGKHIGTYNYEDITRNELVAKMVGRPLTDKFPQREIRLGGPLLAVQGIRRRKVLHDISFELRKGEVLGIAGLMGSGRTELARAIFGADPRDGGQILLEGRAVRINNPTDAIRAGIGYITEDRKRDGLALDMQVDQNITLATVARISNRLGVLSRRREREIADGFVLNLKIKTPGLEQHVVNLSGGNQQKVVLAKWLCRNAKVLIFDEPTRGIDVGAKFEVHELINALVKEGVGVIMISSELPEILGMSDRILVLHEGRIAGLLDSAEATQERILNLAAGLANSSGGTAAASS